MLEPQLELNPDFKAHCDALPLPWLFSLWLGALCLSGPSASLFICCEFIFSRLLMKRNRNLKVFRVFLVLCCLKQPSNFPGRQHQISGSWFLRTSLLNLLSSFPLWSPDAAHSSQGYEEPLLYHYYYWHSFQIVHNSFCPADEETELQRAMLTSLRRQSCGRT